MIRLIVAVALVAAFRAAVTHAQEFSDAAPVGQRSIAALLERGLASADSGLAASALGTRWHGLAEMETRAVAVGLGVRSVRLAVGLSQSGERDLGWSQLALGAGGAGERGGFALRGALRRRAMDAGERDDTGGEVGAGAWVTAAPTIVVWASAPQLWTRGDPPPLERWLEIGARLEREEAHIWLSRAAAPGAPRGLRAEHLAGLLVPAGPAAVWIEARDHPARGTLGLAVATATLRVAAAVESHPVLGETVHLTVSWREKPWW